jgi:hypothetical protein
MELATTIEICPITTIAMLIIPAAPLNEFTGWIACG